MWKDSRKTKRQKTVIRKRTSRGFLFFLLFCTILLNGLSGKNAQAASASITIDTSKKQVVKGDTVYVVITVSSSESIKSFNGYFSYDNRYLQFVNGGSVVHGNDDKFLVDDINRTGSATKLKYSIKFKARKKGSTTIALQKPYKVCADDSSSGEMSVSYNALNIAVLSKKEAIASSQPQQSNTEALPNAIKAGFIGIGIIFIFMILYYRVPGFIACIALTLYVCLTLLVFVEADVALTLPGIAAFLLTVGMAVDANVLIFERVREELRNGMSV